MPFKNDNSHYKESMAEVKVWQSVLEKCSYTSALLKERISQSIVKISDPAIIEEAERFQLKFINHEQMIALLRHDISMLLSKSGTAPDNLKDLQQKIYSIGKDISKMLVECDDVKREIEQFISRIKSSGRLVI